MIPPVDVPETKSKTSCSSRPICACRASKMAAAMIPRIPPPSIERTLIRPIVPGRLCGLVGCEPDVGHRMHLPEGGGLASLLDPRLVSDMCAVVYQLAVS